MAKATLQLQAATLLLSFIELQPAAALQQRHLRGEMTALPHFHRSGPWRGARNKVHVIAAAIVAGSYKPEGPRHRQNRRCDLSS